MKKILLYSGGMDSYLINDLYKPDLKLYIDVNSKYSKDEIKHLPKDVKIDKLDLSQWERPDSIIPLRNLYLIMWATNYVDDEGAEICLGATAGDRVLDKSPAFKDGAEILLNYLYQEQHWTKEKKIIINLDYKQHTKTEILKMYLERGGDINTAWRESFSCYNPIHSGDDTMPCLSCKPCFRKFISFAMCGMKFNDFIIYKSINYIEQEILPLINAGTYGRGEEEKEILNVLEKHKRGELNA